MGQHNPLCGLDSVDFAQTTASLGEHEDKRVVRDGDRDLAFVGWNIGEGSHGTGGEYERDWTRRVDVAVWLTTSGRLVTGVHRSSRWVGEGDKYAGAVHDTANNALAWLREDSAGGGLGPASKEAWEAACERWTPLSGHDTEQANGGGDTGDHHQLGQQLANLATGCAAASNAGDAQAADVGMVLLAMSVALAEGDNRALAELGAAATGGAVAMALDEHTTAALAVLARTEGDGPAEVLAELAQRVADGVYRPGSWERPWLAQAFGDDWLGRLEPDPAADRRERPTEGGDKKVTS